LEANININQSMQQRMEWTTWDLLPSSSKLNTDWHRLLQHRTSSISKQACLLPFVKTYKQSSYFRIFQNEFTNGFHFSSSSNFFSLALQHQTTGYRLMAIVTHVPVEKDNRIVRILPSKYNSFQHIFILVKL